MLQENAQAQHPQLRHPEGVVPDSDAQALVAYLKLLAKVFREGSVPGEGSTASPVIAWMHVLEEETGARPLWEVMFQLMCHPVPQVSTAQECDVLPRHLGYMLLGWTCSVPASASSCCLAFMCKPCWNTEISWSIKCHANALSP